MDPSYDKKTRLLFRRNYDSLVQRYFGKSDIYGYCCNNCDRHL